jgi:arylsulfatase A-like enzyme
MSRPNFLIFMPDQLRADCVGIFGNSFIQAPNIDALAGPGIREDSIATTFAEMVDILPTLLELADIGPAHTHFGKSLVPALHDPQRIVRLRENDCTCVYRLYEDNEVYDQGNIG